MAIPRYVLPDNGIFAALEAVCCPPEELAEALGIDLRTLWGYYGDGARMPAFILDRLITMLHRRSEYLRDVAVLLDSVTIQRDPPMAS